MAVTIEKIAAVARVGRSTVSRALSGGQTSVHPRTREKILRIADDLNYMPSASARSMAGGSTSTIGLYWKHGREMVSPTLLAFLQGLSKELNKHRYNLLMAFGDIDEDHPPRMTVEKHVDGMIIAHSIDDGLLHLLRRNAIPVVLAHAGIREDCDCVTVDNERGAADCVEHLAQLGHRQIAYVNNTDPEFSPVAAEARLLGYIKGMARAKLTCPEGYEHYMETGERIEALYGNGDGPTALVCFDDIAAARSLECLRERNLRVPEDVSIIGFNDSETARAAHPPLSSVSLPLKDVGTQAARMLLERIASPGRPARQFKLEETLVVRGSTGPVGAAG